MSSNSISKLKQISILTKLVLKFCERSDALECIKLAKDLANVIEELNFYNINLSELSEEFFSIFPEHWKKRTQFLLIVTKYWPQILQDLECDITVPTVRCGKINEYTTPPHLEQLLKNRKITISETESIYLEIENTLEIIKKYPNKRVSVISPNESYSYYLMQRLKSKNIEYTSYISNEEITEEFITEIKIHFSDWLNEIPHNKLIKELSKFSNTPKPARKLQIFGVNNYICNGEILICAELNELYWHYKECSIFWLHPIIRKKFNIEADNKKIESIFYKALVDHKQIYLLRSKNSNGQGMKKSFLLSELEAKCKKNQIKIEYHNFFKPRHLPVIPQNTISKDNFKLSPEINVKSLELLIKDPIAFYAKKILNLEPEVIDEKKRNLSIALKSLLYNSFSNISQIQNKLNYIKDLDFFAYKKCLNVLEFIKNRNSGRSLNNISGEINVPNFNFRLHGYCDRIETDSENSTLIIYKTSTPKSTKELLYGDEIEALTTCLIAQNGGFKGIDKPINSVQIWNIMPGKEVVSIKNLEISFETIDNFEQRLNSKLLEILDKEEISFNNQKKQNYNKYKHFERI